MKRTYVYVDGFNLYYGSLKGKPYRWLNLAELCRLLLPSNDVSRINYYTAHVGQRVGDPDQPLRQQTYLRALRTLPGVRIHLGHYLSHVVSMPLASPSTGGPRFVRVIKTEEKGSDVNLASHLLSDGYEDRFDVAVLITNDSDLLSPVEIVRARLSKPIGVLNPHKHPSIVLAKAATFFKQIRAGSLGASQFPDEVVDATGPFHKPVGW